MADIARIGFAADTSELAGAKSAIQALVPPAKEAEQASDKLANAIKKADNAAAGLSNGASKGAKAADNLAAGTGRATSAIEEMAGAINRENAALNSSVGAHNKAAGAVRGLGAAIGAIPASQAKAAAGVRGLGAALEAASGNLKLTARDGLNLSRQFADIGVTAAMGMNPLMIAIQQGPQLLDIFQEKAVSTGQSVGTVFKVMAASVWASIAPFVAVGAAIAAVVAVVAILALGYLAGERSAMAYQKAVTGVGRTAGITAGQLRDLTIAGAEQGNISIKAAQEQAVAYLRTGKIGGEVLTDLIAVGKDYASFMGVDAATATQDLAKAMEDPSKAAKEMTREFGLLTQEQIKQIDAFMKAGDQMAAQRILLDALKGATEGHADQVNGMTNAWDALGRSISNAITRFGEWLYVTDTEMLARLDKSLGDNADWWDKPMTPWNRRAREEQRDELAFANLRRVWTGNNAAIAGQRNQAAQLITDRADTPKRTRTARGGKTNAEKFSDIVGGVNNDMAAVTAQIEGIDLTREAAARLVNEQKLLNEAQSKGITLTTGQRAELIGLAGDLTQLQTELANLQGFKDIREGADRRLDDLAAEGEMIGLVGEQLAYAQAEQSLLNEATAKSIKLDAEQTRIIREKADAIAKATVANQAQRFMQNQFDAFGENMIALQDEADLIGLGADATLRLRSEQNMLAEARRSNLALSEPEIQMLKALARHQSDFEIEVRKTREAFAFTKDTFTGFIGDMRSGLMQGQSLWQTFGNAVLNVLNKVIDKLIEAQIEGLFNQAGGDMSKGGSGGWIGTAVNFAKAFLSNAKGNAFDGGGQVNRFAAGGAFTNSVVSSPTMFSFAKGTALGEMGEAGPEAIMPLQRGPDGSLGVQMYGASGGGGGTMINAPVNIEQHYHLDGAISGKDVMALVQEGKQQAVDETKRSITGWIDTYNKDGTLV